MFNNGSFETGDLTGWIKLGELTFNNYSFETGDLTGWSTINNIGNLSGCSVKSEYSISVS